MLNGRSNPTAPRTLYFSRVYKKPVRVQGQKRKLGRASDLVFALQEPLPSAVGVFIDHGWGVPSEFIPWGCVRSMDETGLEVLPLRTANATPPSWTSRAGSWRTST